MIVHTIRRGQFLRALRPPGDSCVPAQISQLQVGMEGHIVVQTSLEERSHREVQQYTPKIYCRGHKNTQSYKFLNMFIINSAFCLSTGQVLDSCLLSERLPAVILHHRGAGDGPPPGV